MHKISYKNTTSTWDEALPLGNGHFGAMIYNEGNKMVHAINHYDIYYRKYWMYSKKYRNKANKEQLTDTSRYELIKKRALEVRENPDDPAYHNYNYTLHPEFKEYYGWDRRGTTLPMTGELHLVFNEPFENADQFESCLDIKEAKYRFTAKTSEDNVNICTLIGQDNDIMITNIKQAPGKNNIDAIDITLPERRMFETKKEYKIYDSRTIYFINSFYPDGEDKEKYGPFKYVFMTRIEGAENSDLLIKDNGAEIKIIKAKDEINILTCVVTEDSAEDIVETAAKMLDKAVQDIDEILENHETYWDRFWSKSAINIPDKMLEKLWYINLYSLECCNGRGARLYEQACGLNGLWDIKQPSQWGSLWYWDVNIQQSFWPVYTSNHLEIGEAFYNGLMSYVDAAKKRAKEFYGFKGIAPDYPFDFYICIWPWCAQFFWWHYSYSNDKNFLKEKAYPLFKDILLFFEEHLRYDSCKEQYYIFPDISPEQGPVTRNSTITLACLKFLLKVSIESNKVLNECEEDRKKWENILYKLPYYSTGESNEFGKTLKDSEWALPTQYLAHSSPLMPIYPVGDISKRSNMELRNIAQNTLEYVKTLQGIGTHNFGWEACAAARLGLGNEAIRILYENGIAFQMRTNGLFAEETERWIQNCITALTPSYHPPLIEAGSATVAAINEMLLQSFNGVIEVFPALPCGIKADKGITKTHRNFDDVTDLHFGELGEWKDCSFDKLLAEGAFEVSACMKGGETIEVKIKSLAGKLVKIINPFVDNNIIIKCENQDVKFNLEDNIIEFETLRGKLYIIKAVYSQKNEGLGNSETYVIDKDEQQQGCPEIYIAPSKRRVFLGKDHDTEFLRELDNITFDYYQGDIRTSRISVYKFDFSLPKENLEKNYKTILPKQFHACGKLGLDFIRITKDTSFTPTLGYGWEDTKSLVYIDRELPDPLRRDFVCGYSQNTFKVELTKGQYQIFISTGDSIEAIHTAIDINGQQKWEPKSVIKAGRFEAVTLPIIQWKDGITEISFSTVKKCKWNINMMIINRLF